MKFRVNGPYELPKTKKGLIDTNAAARRLFWQQVDERFESVAEACGCYVFAIQAARGTLPWYVGKAEKQSLKKECLTPHKIITTTTP